MKTGFVIVTYKTPESEIKRLHRQIKELNCGSYMIVTLDNTHHNIGFATRANDGIKQAYENGCDLIVLCNPDISLEGITEGDIIAGQDHADIWGGVITQDGKTYYGGEIDPWRLSGSLTTKKPNKRFSEVQFVSGSLMIIKRKVIQKIGYLDPSYFMYMEDVEYSQRAKNAGFKVCVDLKLAYTHFNWNAKSYKKRMYLFTSRMKYFMKKSTLPQKIHELKYLPKLIGEYVYLFANSSSFMRNFLSLNISSLANRGINFILFLFLINILTTESYGIYSLAWVHVGLLAPFIDMGTTSYGIVYLSKKHSGDFIKLFSLRIVIGFLVYILTLMLIFVMNYEPKIGLYIGLTSTAIIANMLSGSLLILSSIREKLHIPAILSILFNAVLTTFLIISLYLFENLGAFFITVALLYFLYGIVNIHFILRGLSIDLHSAIVASINSIRTRSLIHNQLAAWKMIFMKSYVFVLISLFAGLYYKADIFLLKYIVGNEAVGVYSAGYKFFDALLFIAAAYNMSSTPILANLVKKSKVALLQKVKSDFLMLIALGGAISLITFVFSPIVMPYILKGSYVYAIDVLRVVIFALPLILLTSIFLNSLYVMGKAYLVIVIFAVQTCINIGLNLLYIPKYSFMASAYITVFSEIINVGIAFYFFYYVVKRYQCQK